MYLLTEETAQNPQRSNQAEEVTQEGTGTDVQILLPTSVFSKLPHHNCFLKILIIHGKKLALMEVIRSNFAEHINTVGFISAL